MKMRLSLSKLLYSAVLLTNLFALTGVNGQCIGEPSCLGGDAFDAQQYYKENLSADGSWPCDGCVGGSCSMCGLTYIAEAVEEACSNLVSGGCSLNAREYMARGVQSYDCEPVLNYCSSLSSQANCVSINGCSWIGQPPPLRPPPIQSPPVIPQKNPSALAVDDTSPSSSSSTSTGGVFGGLVVVALYTTTLLWQ